MINNPVIEISNKITKPKKKLVDGFIYYQGWYGETPIGNVELVDKNYKKIFVFSILFDKN